MLLVNKVLNFMYIHLLMVNFLHITENPLGQQSVNNLTYKYHMTCSSKKPIMRKELNTSRVCIRLGLMASFMRTVRAPLTPCQTNSPFVGYYFNKIVYQNVSIKILK